MAEAKIQLSNEELAEIGRQVVQAIADSPEHMVMVAAYDHRRTIKVMAGGEKSRHNASCSILE